jgi:hypothetical protein
VDIELEENYLHNYELPVNLHGNANAANGFDTENIYDELGPIEEYEDANVNPIPESEYDNVDGGLHYDDVRNLVPKPKEPENEYEAIPEAAGLISKPADTHATENVYANESKAIARPENKVVTDNTYANKCEAISKPADINDTEYAVNPENIVAGAPPEYMDILPNA